MPAATSPADTAVAATPANEPNFDFPPLKPDERLLLNEHPKPDLYWRLYLYEEEDGANLDFRDRDASGAGGSMVCVDQTSGLFVCEGNIMRSNYAYVGGSPKGTARISATTKSGQVLATTHLGSDPRFPNRRYFVVVVPFDDPATTIEAYDSSGKRLAQQKQSDPAPLPSGDL